jgi:hypothetical protein
MATTYHSDLDDADDVKYIIYEIDTAMRRKTIIATETDSSDIMAVLYDNVDREKQNRQYRYEYLVSKVVGAREREVSSTTYSVDEIEKFPRGMM